MTQRIWTHGLSRVSFPSTCSAGVHGAFQSGRIMKDHSTSSALSNGDNKCQQNSHPVTTNQPGHCPITVAKHQPGVKGAKGKRSNSHQSLFFKHKRWILALLSCWLQFADLKPHEEVVLAHTLAQAVFAQGIELCSWYLKKGIKKKCIYNDWTSEAHPRAHFSDPRSYVHEQTTSFSIKIIAYSNHYLSKCWF